LEAPSFETPRSGDEGSAAVLPQLAVPGRAGELIRSQRLDRAPPGSIAVEILYWSTTVTDVPVPVSGLLFMSEMAIAAHRRWIVAWGHGTYGLGSHCTNRAYFSWAQRAGAVTRAVRDGAVIVATDYQGLGTPGPHPYLVGQAAARNLLDAVRAASNLCGADADMPAVVIGLSQGGTAALIAAEVWQQYASEVRLVGAMAVAPAVELEQLHQVLDGGAWFGHVPMAVYGFLAAYEELTCHCHLLTPAGRLALADIGNRTSQEILTAFAYQTKTSFGFDALLDTHEFRLRLRANSPGWVSTSVPIVILHGEQDDTIPVSLCRSSVRRYQELGTAVTARFLPDVGHADVLQVTAEGILAFASACCQRDPDRKGVWVPS
jgi:pimeloyl-ACP methyl ester carboxylesterase